MKDKHNTRGGKEFFDRAETTIIVHRPKKKLAPLLKIMITLILFADIASLYTLNTVAIVLFTSMLVFLLIARKKIV